ncbi:U2 snRNP-associated SURP motif-containing protein isoform X2 [Anopheles funestus]|uniref:U2 snRNP-associated SURP motif-containing protein isoform X2 n=1 Tax=Anopheles funestus TaxID=62324 RepID=UPI0020C69D49|nr:U2 snRNP-associated SURP motif-containing protein isoform X2 [Anopheles funestus]
MGKRPMSRKEIEEQKKREDEAAAAHAFKEFVETFQEAPSKISKVWVKAGTYDAGSRKEDTKDRGKLYKPQSRLDMEHEKSMDYVKMVASESRKDSGAMGKKRNQEKKKSNLEMFKEELRQIQEEREERHKYKHMARTMLPGTSSTESDPVYKETESGSFDNGDPNTTNLYLGNLNPKISEQALMELFGKYGPLASIKIMWPRSEEEKMRNRNCGFVAYMSRRDAERALRALNGRDVMGYEMKLGWGKSVPIMTHPIYIPPKLLAYTLPPPPSGLPFNAQPHPSDLENIPKMTSGAYMAEPELKEQMDSVLVKSVVKVVIPTERPLLMLIHRMVEFVIREGPMFEALIMTKEMDNPMYKFLFENESPAHIYYRWKLFSLLQGDTPGDWRTKEFRMFKGGSIWKPPPINFYTQGMPDELLADEEGIEANKGNLSVAQRDRLEDLIRHLTPERQKIGDAMIFCIEHADAAEEICECITESLSSNETVVKKKVARIYLISDILHNSAVKVQNASFFRKAMEKNLLDIFRNLNAYYMQLDSRLKAEGFKSRVMGVFRAWEEWTIYPREFLVKLQHTFLGIQMMEKQPEEEPEEEKEDEDLDGVPLDGAALLKSAMMCGMTSGGGGGGGGGGTGGGGENRTPLLKHDIYSDEDDIDGMPLADDDIDGMPLDSAMEAGVMDGGRRGGTSISGSEGSGRPGKGKSAGGGSFIPSKWESVDAAQIEAQAITTSKWDTLDPVVPEPPKISLQKEGGAGLISSKYGSYSDDDDEDEDDDDDDAALRQEGEGGRTAPDQDELRRVRLREIEVKMVQYTDEFESGTKQVRTGWTLHEEIDSYRMKLMKEMAQELRARGREENTWVGSDDESRSRRGQKRTGSVESSRKHKRSRQSARSPASSGYGDRKRDSASPESKSSRRRHSTSTSDEDEHTTRTGDARYRYSSERSVSPGPAASSSSRTSKYDLLGSPARHGGSASESNYDKYERRDARDGRENRSLRDKKDTTRERMQLSHEREHHREHRDRPRETDSRSSHGRERDRERERDRSARDQQQRDREREYERDREVDGDAGGSSSRYRERERAKEGYSSSSGGSRKDSSTSSKYDDRAHGKRYR